MAWTTPDEAAVSNDGCQSALDWDPRSASKRAYSTPNHNGERRRGLSHEAAIYEAALLRFRPIMMTTMAALLGGLPLALGTGAGSELRRPLGIAIVGGLIVSQLLTLYTTPVVYLALDRLRLRWHRQWHGPLAVGEGA